MTKMILPHGMVHNFTYNGLELLGKYQPPIIAGVNDTDYEYNLDKQLTKITLPDNREINYNYNNSLNDNLTGIGTAEGYRSFWYNGELITSNKIEYSTIEDANNKLDFTYLGKMLKSETSGPISGNYYSKITFGFDDRFRVKSMELRDGTTTPYMTNFFYDKDGLLIRSGDLTIERDDTGKVARISIGNTKTSNTYDLKFGELTKIESSMNNKNIFLREFKRDKLGRIVEENTGNGWTTISYDKAGRLTGRSYKNSGAAISNFQYDKNGNRIKGFDGQKSFTAQFDSHDRLIKFNQNTYTYNANGQLSNKTTPQGNIGYTYDSLGNLRKVDFGSKVIDYDIDGKDRRIAKRIAGNVVTRYVWENQLRIAAELNSSNVVQKRFIYGTGINVPDYMIYQGKKYFFVKDHRGSVNMVVDVDSGEVKQKISYTEWGEIIEDTNPGFQPFGFAGGLYDQDTKLVRFGARDYDPEIGRWLAKDPIRFNGGDSNLYGYVLNDPINFIDPKGEGAWSVVGAGMMVGGVFVGVGSGGTGAVVGICMIAAGAKMISEDRKEQLNKELNELQKSKEAELQKWNGVSK